MNVGLGVGVLGWVVVFGGPVGGSVGCCVGLRWVGGWVGWFGWVVGSGGLVWWLGRVGGSVDGLGCWGVGLCVGWFGGSVGGCWVWGGLVLLQQMSKRSRPFTDEALKHTQARRQSQSRWAKEFSRWLQCDTKRAHLWSQLKKKTQSDVKCQESPSQASGDRLRFPGSTWNPEVADPEVSVSESYHRVPKREQKNAPSWSRRNGSHNPEPRHRETDCSQRKMRT